MVIHTRDENAIKIVSLDGELDTNTSSPPKNISVFQFRL